MTTNDALDLPTGVVVGLPADPAPAVAVEYPQAPSIGAETPDPTVFTVPIPGPPGAPGDGPTWWFGNGEPGTILGSKPGDRYLDQQTGAVYRLGDQ